MMEKITCLTATSIKGYSDSNIAIHEKNDCVVRAIAVSFNIHYDKAHNFVKKKLLRKDRKGTTDYFITSIFKQEKILNKKIKIEYSEYNRDIKVPKMTLLKFLKKYNKGNYFILVRCHALAIKDGVIFGNYDDGLHLRRIVEYAYKIGGRQ